MKTETVENIIIGGGLSGIYSAYLLASRNESFVLLEARERLGGRILCAEHEGLIADMGPSWYWPEIQPKMAGLIDSLGIEVYRQYENGLGRFQLPGGEVRTVRGYDMEPLSWRLSGGMIALIDELSRLMPEGSIRLNHPVCRIEKEPSGVSVIVGELEREPLAEFRSRRLILALPPRLAASTILFEPELSHPMAQEMLKIGTWMAGQAKFCAIYEEPFWRDSGLSGQAFSQLGPMGEIHDASNNGKGPYGLTGFLGIPAVQRNNRDLLIKAILSQLSMIYGESAGSPETIFYKDWARERFTATSYDQPPMYQHPYYHPPAGKTSIWEGRICLAGTETSTHQGGYLEGALAAAERAADDI